MLVKTFGSALFGINAIPITIEVNIDKGVNFYMVGLPDSAVKESHQRIEAALKNIGYKIPGKKIIINLAPADIKKEGSAYDLPIAIGILAAAEKVNNERIQDYLIMGELSLDGGLQPIKGALPIAIEVRKHGYKGLFLPKINAKEAAIVSDIDVYGLENILEIIQFFNNEKELKPIKIDPNEAFKNEGKFLRQRVRHLK